MNVWTWAYRIGLLLLVILIAIGVVAIFAPQVEQYRELRRKEALLQEEIRLEQETLRHLQEQQQRLMTDPRFVEKIAREELRYIRPGETVFKFVDDEPATYPPSR